MIQRIQSIYLLITIFLFGLFINMDFFSFSVGNDIYNMNVFGLSSENTANTDKISTTPVAVLSFIILFVELFSIFQYKNRIKQIRICIFNILLMIGLYILIGVYVFVTKEEMSIIQNEASAPGIAMIIPFFGIILTYLAIRAIGSDEALIRSLDHLR